MNHVTFCGMNILNFVKFYYKLRVKHRVCFRKNFVNIAVN